MATRTPGVPVGEHVRLLEPTAAKPYYRLVYTDANGKRHYPSGGAKLSKALQRAKELDAWLSGVADATSRTLGDLVAAYVATARGRHRDKHGYLTGRDWSTNHHTTVRRNLTRAVQDLETTPVGALDRAAVDHLRSACGTHTMVKQLTSQVRMFLRWLHEQGAISDAQLALLPEWHARDVAPRFAQPEPRPARVRTARMHGQSDNFVADVDCAGHPAIDRFATELQHLARWGELAVQCAPATGLRIGEQFQLTAYDFEELADGLWVRVDWQWHTGPTRRALPKTGKRRRVPVADVTRSGYPLGTALRRRITEAKAEQAAGTNPEALLFPAPEGGMWWPGALNELLVKAAVAAGWSHTVVPELRTLRNGRKDLVPVTQMDLTWHSLRHRFARDMIDWAELTPGQLMAVGGWDSLDVVNTRYYQSGQEHTESAAAKMRRAPATEDTGFAPLRTWPAPRGTRVTRAPRTNGRPMTQRSAAAYDGESPRARRQRKNT